MTNPMPEALRGPTAGGAIWHAAFSIAGTGTLPTRVGGFGTLASELDLALPKRSDGTIGPRRTRLGRAWICGLRESAALYSGTFLEAPMSKSDERKLAALVKKNAAKAAKAKKKERRQYDKTLPPEAEEDTELRDFFSEMKKREF
jgi:hypothetical protein